MWYKFWPWLATILLFKSLLTGISPILRFGETENTLSAQRSAIPLDDVGIILSQLRFYSLTDELSIVFE